MSDPGVRTSAHWWRYGLLGAIALGLSLMCANYVIASASTMSSTDMASMSATAVTKADQVPASGTSGMAGMCDAGCASEITAMVCSVIAVAAPLGLLLLLLTRRRTPFLGLLTRITVQPMVWTVRERWRGWVPLSPTTLCVWRV